ncbi:hypothetical protein [Kochikohdavirus PBEF19]|uniref:Uncharacterized protein n=1 Tax=Enterococcus phage PBEF129 TaxID=2696337 RepID=A0A7T3JEC2_9CAUD|nr:hypothetical protein [Enterococcus phage PBEF129]
MRNLVFFAFCEKGFLWVCNYTFHSVCHYSSSFKVSYSNSSIVLITSSSLRAFAFKLIACSSKRSRFVNKRSASVVSASILAWIASFTSTLTSATGCSFSTNSYCVSEMKYLGCLSFK